MQSPFFWELRDGLSIPVPSSSICLLLSKMAGDPRSLPPPPTIQLTRITLQRLSHFPKADSICEAYWGRWWECLYCHMSMGDSLWEGPRPTPHADFRYICPRRSVQKQGFWGIPVDSQQEAQVPRSKMGFPTHFLTTFLTGWEQMARNVSKGDPSLASRQRSVRRKGTMMFPVPAVFFC